MRPDYDLALEAAAIQRVTGDTYSVRQWQGIPGVECSPDGTLWAAFYSGGRGEGVDNYVALVRSGDRGRTWSDLQYVIDPPGQVRAFDPCLWSDPAGRLWVFWSQSFSWYDGRCGVWASVCTDPDAAATEWSSPRRIADGIMMNKPTVLNNGEWLLPIAVWVCHDSPLNELPELTFSNVYVSADQGETFGLRGSADIPNRHFDEHMLVERGDGSLWMLVRTFYGIGESVSLDGGRTWSPGKPTTLGGPSSRFFIRRLHSGRLLLVNHYGFKGRSHLTAMLSEDDGLSWQGGLILDERADVSYPDGVQDNDGQIYVIYDRERDKAKEILLAVFTEEDIRAGTCVSKGAALKQIVNKARN
ncbi:sialidase family protein [Paenibacillus filicis]|uniref:Sialidase family protein n=1 Tax=Paenibacillus filicis TaxID=669464 RepID=A0ABU9DG07_9BACL